MKRKNSKYKEKQERGNQMYGGPGPDNTCCANKKPRNHNQKIVDNLLEGKKI